MERATFGAPIPASSGADCFYCMRRPAGRHSSIINPPQRQCELFVSRNVSPLSESAFQPGTEGRAVDGKWKAVSAPDSVTGVDRWPIYRRSYRVNRRALSNTTNSIRTQQQQRRRRRRWCIITQGSNLQRPIGPVLYACGQRARYSS